MHMGQAHSVRRIVKVALAKYSHKSNDHDCMHALKIITITIMEQ